MSKRRKKRPEPRTRSGEQLRAALNFSIAEISLVAGWPRSRTYALIASGQLETVKVGRNRYATRAQVERCLERLEAESAEAA